MTPSRFTARTLVRLPRAAGRTALAVAVAATGLAWAGCSKQPEITAADSVSDARIAELEKTVRDLKAEHDQAVNALGATGSENVSLGRAIADMRARMRRLEETVAAGTVAAKPAVPGDATGGGDDAGRASPAGSGSIAPTTDGAFSPEQEGNFEKLWDRVQEVKNERVQRDHIHELLAAADVTLTSEQEAALAKLQRDYAKKREEIYKRAPGTPRRSQLSDADRAAEREAQLAKWKELQSQFEDDVRKTLPANVSDSVVTALQRGLPGFFRDRGGRPGMGN